MESSKKIIKLYYAFVDMNVFKLKVVSTTSSKVKVSL